MAEQNARIEDGSGNIIVQADHSTVAIGAPAALRLFPWHRRPRAASSDIALLDPFTLSVPFAGRAAELARLEDWLCAPAPILARCLTGRAGSGKTRLALELCDRSEALDGWDAGFLGHAELQRFFARENIGTWGWRRPTLIVLDYAAGCGQALKPWLEELAQNRGDPERPLRLLLLERFADDGAGWWAELTRTGWSNAGIPALFDPPAPEPLAELAAEDRGALVAGLLERTGSTADAGRIEAQAERADSTDALDLLMAGLTAAKGIAGGDSAGGRTGMAFALADHERNRLDAIARNRALDAALLAHLAAMLTLQGGAAADVTLEMAAVEVDAMRSRSDPRALHAALCDAYAPDASERLPPILPDLIGEAFVLASFERARLAAGRQAQAITRAYARNEAATVAAVIRTAQDFAEAQTHPALRWLEALVTQCSDAEALMRLDEAFPQATLVLREQAAAVTAALAGRLRQLPVDPQDSTIPAQRATALNNLSNRLGDLGRREEALAAIEEAVAIRRDLALARPDAFRPVLATSLNNLSNRLGDLGRREEGLAAIEEAVAVYRDLALARPDTFRPDLALSLNNLSLRLGDLGRREEGLAAIEEAVAVYRDLALARPDTFRPDLALSLNNLSLRLGDLGRREEGLAAIEEAVAVYRDLALARPDAFRPDLALSLNNLSLRLGDLGRREEALLAIEEAVAIRRDLALARPDAFRPVLATSLNNLSLRLGDLGRREEALLAIEEAVAVYRDLALARPDAFRPVLATSLNNLSLRLGDLGRREEALLAIEEAVAIRRDLALARPDVFRADLARSLAVLGNCLEAADRLETALEADCETVALLTVDLTRWPQAYAGLMGAVCRGYLRRCEKAGVEPDEALLAPVIAVFERLQGGNAEEQATAEE